MRRTFLSRLGPARNRGSVLATRACPSEPDPPKHSGIQARILLAEPYRVDGDPVSGHGTSLAAEGRRGWDTARATYREHPQHASSQAGTIWHDGRYVWFALNDPTGYIVTFSCDHEWAWKFAADLVMVGNALHNQRPSPAPPLPPQ